MAKTFQTTKRTKLPLVLSIVAVVILAVSALVISGNFEKIVTPFAPLIKPQASSSQPKLTQSFSDAFKSDAINTEKWAIWKNGNVTIQQTTANNLRMDIPQGSESGKVKQGSITFKESLDDKGDFRIITVLYPTTVTGEGSGVTGMRFASAGTGDDEGAVVKWVVNTVGTTTTRKVQFIVRGPDGKALFQKEADFSSPVGMLRLDRVNKTYRAYYKAGRDTSGDTAWTSLGEFKHTTLGNGGKLSLYTTNQAKNYPKVAGRFDEVRIRWEGDPSTRTEFSDSFANQVIGTNWKTWVTTGATIRETKNENLNITVPTGAISGKAGSARLTRKEPVVKEGKDFVMTTKMSKPVVTGEGKGAAGIAFRSFTDVDKEAMQVRWVVAGSTSKLVFYVTNPDGTLAEKASKDVTATTLTLMIIRKGDKYAAAYRVGDNDADWIYIGKEEKVEFGANGSLGLFVSNVGEATKYPKVTARFDGVWGWTAK